MAKQTKRQKKAKVIVKAWKDPEFKKKLMSDPHKTLKEMGIDVPKDIKLKIVENSEKEITALLPPPPENKAMTDEELEKIAGGGAMSEEADALKQW